MNGSSMYVVDAFASRRFQGNPAAICVLPRPAKAGWMQHLSAEMNLSETAFVSPRAEGWDLRWFTPKVEVALCGHATLASAHILCETGRAVPGSAIRFLTKSGWLTATAGDGRIEMDFPAGPVSPVLAPSGLLEALGTKARFVGQTPFDSFVEVPDATILRRLAPDFVALARLPARGVIVTAISDEPGFDFVSRFFAPAAGINEDPVTGSAHCSLGPYWQARLGRSDFTGFQASARGGVVSVSVRGDRVLLGGQAITVLRGELA